MVTRSVGRQCGGSESEGGGAVVRAYATTAAAMEALAGATIDDGEYAEITDAGLVRKVVSGAFAGGGWLESGLLATRYIGESDYGWEEVGGLVGVDGNGDITLTVGDAGDTSSVHPAGTASGVDSASEIKLKLPVIDFPFGVRVKVTTTSLTGSALQIALKIQDADGKHISANWNGSALYPQTFTAATATTVYSAGSAAGTMGAKVEGESFELAMHLHRDGASSKYTVSGGEWGNETKVSGDGTNIFPVGTPPADKFLHVVAWRTDANTEAVVTIDGLEIYGDPEAGNGRV